MTISKAHEFFTGKAEYQFPHIFHIVYISDRSPWLQIRGEFTS
ncbi:hypothetical protein [Nostoc sp. MG11]|nr:hypothetical protein [Nostoc sp. MG11]